MKAGAIGKVSADGYTNISCSFCYRRLHKDEKVVEVVGRFYHDHHDPSKVKDRFRIVPRGLRLKDLV